MISLEERDLESGEILNLTADLKAHVKSIDTTVLAAFLDLIKPAGVSENIISLNIRYHAKGYYYFHIPTGWLLTTMELLPLLRNRYKQLCYKLYYRNFIASVYDSIVKAKSSQDLVTLQKKLTTSKGLRKIAYRLVLCLRKGDQKSHLLIVARHISILYKPALVSSLTTMTALIRSKNIARRLGKTYPHVAKIDTSLKSLIIGNELSALKMMKNYSDKAAFIYTP